MEQELWLARDGDGFYGFFEGDPYKKYWGDWEIDDGGWASDKISPADFRKIFGCHPVRKSCKKRIKRIVVELED